MPAFTRFVFPSSAGLFYLQLAIVFLTWALVFAYVGGPRLRTWIRRIAPAVPDCFLYRVPWRRKRPQRDFSAMLAVLLDSGVPEVEAVTMAADSTSNTTVQRRAKEFCARLAAGDKL